MEKLQDVIDNHIIKMFSKYSYDIRECARHLGISRYVLERKAKTLGLEFSRPPVFVPSDIVHFRSQGNGFYPTFCNAKTSGVRTKYKITNQESEVTCKRCISKMQVTWASREREGGARL